MKRLTKHLDEFMFDLIDLADLLGVPIGCRAKDKCRGKFRAGSISAENDGLVLRFESL